MVTDWFAGLAIATAMAIFGNTSPCGIASALVTLPLVAVADRRVLSSVVVSAYLVRFALLALAFFYQATPHVWTISPSRSLLSDPRVSSAVIAAGMIYELYNVSLVMVIGFGSLMLIERRWTIAAASSSTSLVLCAFSLSLPLGRWLADRTSLTSSLFI